MSQIFLISFNAFFNKEIITQATAAKGFRVVMGVSKRGSWDQLLTLVITDPQTQEIAKDLGKNALYDLLKWTLNGGIGVGSILAFRKSRKRARELERERDDIQEKLDEALKRVHAPIKHQGLTVQVMSGKTVLAHFDDMTLQYLETEIYDEEQEVLECSISRFNARTGTGRLIRSLDAASTPFVPVGALSKAHKTLLSDSLGHVVRDDFRPVRVLVSKISDAGGRVKRYRLHHVIAQ